MSSKITRIACVVACFASFCAMVSSALPARASNLGDVFNTLVTGNRTDYSGTVGFEFTATSTFLIGDLGRAVNPTAALAQTHLVQLWDDTAGPDFGHELGHVTVGPSTPLDAVGYAIAPLSTPIAIISGHTYDLTSQEVDGNSDKWGDQTNLTGDYKASLMTVVQAVYGTGFPTNTQSILSGYVVPTFVVVAPEPSSLILCGLGAFGLCIAARRRRKA